jgi:RND superfamily putative drug exporter
VAAAAVMIALGLPVLGISFTQVDARVLPTSSSARQVSDALTQNFAQDRSDPIVVAVDAPRSAGPEVTAYAAEVGGVPGVRSVDRPQYAGGSTWVINAVPAGEALSGQSQDAVQGIRDLAAPAPVLVGGSTADFVDNRASIAAHLPAAIAVIAAATIILIFLLTGSLVLALLSIVMNALTLVATMGILAIGFGEGAFESIFGFDSLGGVSLTQPILIAALAFGLSTDYGVFLLSRMKEARDRGLDTNEAIAVGLQHTGRIVTAAAILFVIAIGAFATSQIVIIKELGVGTALAVLLDATIVRMLLVPSLMGVFGRWTWWAPRPLARLHARLGLSEA